MLLPPLLEQAAHRPENTDFAPPPPPQQKCTMPRAARLRECANAGTEVTHTQYRLVDCLRERAPQHSFVLTVAQQLGQHTRDMAQTHSNSSRLSQRLSRRRYAERRTLRQDWHCSRATDYTAWRGHEHLQQDDCMACTGRTWKLTSSSFCCTQARQSMPAAPQQQDLETM